jgi:ubiquinone/menaquinone biosynthesis C-methylase UbiE
VNDVISRLQRLKRDGCCARVPERWVAPRANRLFLEQLQDYYGIKYLAPFDARDTQLAVSSVDCITSTNTLEHIPLGDIKAILRECRRILKDDGLMSFRIDYQDHYSYFDGSISAYNFLQYSERQWKVFNPALHYQNRLRHRDYLALVTEAGFSVLEENVESPSAEDLRVLRDIRLDARFRSYPPEELGVRSSLIVFHKGNG